MVIKYLRLPFLVVHCVILNLALLAPMTLYAGLMQCVFHCGSLSSPVSSGWRTADFISFWHRRSLRSAPLMLSVSASQNIILKRIIWRCCKIISLQATWCGGGPENLHPLDWMLVNFFVKCEVINILGLLSQLFLSATAAQKPIINMGYSKKHLYKKVIDQG